LVWIKADKEPYLADLTFCPFLVAANSGMSLLRTSMKRFYPTEMVGSKMIPLTLLFWI